MRHQEIPACYFTRNFSVVKSYLGEGQWRVETQPPGPPWGQAAFCGPRGVGGNRITRERQQDEPLARRSNEQWSAAVPER